MLTLIDHDARNLRIGDAILLPAGTVVVVVGAVRERGAYGFLLNDAEGHSKALTVRDGQSLPVTILRPTEGNLRPLGHIADATIGNLHRLPLADAPGTSADTICRLAGIR